MVQVTSVKTSVDLVTDNVEQQKTLSLLQKQMAEEEKKFKVENLNTILIHRLTSVYQDDNDTPKGITKEVIPGYTHIYFFSSLYLTYYNLQCTSDC